MTPLAGNGPKIALVGAGGMSFGPTMANDVIRTPNLAGARLVLHDIDAQRLARAYRFASKLNAAAGTPVELDHTTDAARALDGADFVIVSAEVGRFKHWREDFEIPHRYGARQITGENGGPGAVFHSLRSINTTLGICRDIEHHCPDAFMVNLSNPMSRVTLAINRATKIRNVGMCHEMPIGIHRLARLLRIDASRVEAKASGINHFTFFTEMRDASTGDDLLPRVHDLFSKRFFNYGTMATAAAKAASHWWPTAALADQFYSPLVVHMVREYGLVPCSIDSHIGEYLPFARDVADYHPVPVDIYEGVDRGTERLSTWVADTRLPLPLRRVRHSLEEVIPIIAALWTGISTQVVAVNVPNWGYLPNVAEGAIVEVGATVDGDGIHPDAMPPIEEPIAGHIATQVALQDLVVESALTGNPDLAFQALLDDPLSPPDAAACRTMFDELLSVQAPRLPF